MRKALRAVTVGITLIFAASSLSFAYTDDILGGMWGKLTRGLVNTATGWLELPSQTVRGFKESDDHLHQKIPATMTGFIRGIFHAVGRTAWGVIETAGFWTANPKDNLDQGLWLDSEYVWQNSSISDYFYDTYNSGPGKIGGKFLRGVENTCLGLLEVPGQFVKGYKLKTSDLGISRSVWFAASREFYGVTDLVTLFLPSPRENPGYAFEEEKPWEALSEIME